MPAYKEGKGEGYQEVESEGDCDAEDGTDFVYDPFTLRGVVGFVRNVY